MRKIILKSILVLLSSIITIPITPIAQADNTSCPSGYTPSTLTNVCIASNLAPNIVQPIGLDQTCPYPYEQPIGINFCIQANSGLNILNNQYLITGPYPARDGCPKKFSRAQGSSICTANHLALTYSNPKLTLIEPKLNCPNNFEQLPGAISCTHITNHNNSSYELSSPVCAPGFIKPYGVHFCLDINITINTNARTQYGITPPTISCPTLWHKPQSGGFCIPSTNLVTCGFLTFPCHAESGDTYRVETGEYHCGTNPTARHINTPLYNSTNPLGLAIIPAVACGKPSPPGRGEPWYW